ncbi:response regulator [Nocardioides lijunqiniae]|uniref:response regulator n=1 Tax=Nocardioides lijunqiniae TaxID=2760832 RepID=UPI001877F61D|nr:response regulator [Nocardioides lijunqiniae]
MTMPTVLVVDDDEMIRQLTEMSLESVNGWTVLTASGGGEAIELARRHHPDAMLLDMMMPDMDGLTTFQHLQDDETTRDIPVILFTAKSTVGQQQPWDGYAISGVIAKPFDPMSLGDQIAEKLRWTHLSGPDA